MTRNYQKHPIFETVSFLFQQEPPLNKDLRLNPAKIHIFLSLFYIQFI
jgi:hypothetical protein